MRAWAVSRGRLDDVGAEVLEDGLQHRSHLGLELAIRGRFRCQKKQGAGIDQLGGFSRGHADQVLFSAVGDIQTGQALM